MTEFEKQQIQTRNCLYFLESHPALGCNGDFSVFESLSFSIQKCCKRGECDSSKNFYSIYNSSKYAKKFKKEFQKEFQKEFAELDKDFEEFKNTTKDKKLIARKRKMLKVEKGLVNIYTTYEKVFDEPWKFDHIEYWGELSLKIFTGNIKKNKSFKEYFDGGNWESWAGPTAGGKTFEEMIIKITRKFKKDYGNFKAEDFLTDKEKKNHEKEECFLKQKKDKTGYSLISNPKRIRVENAELNRRWLEWFSKTDYCKKNWELSVGPFRFKN